MRKQYGFAFVVLFAVLICSPHKSFADTPSFDPDQPFRQAFSSAMLRAVLNHTLDLIVDHLEITGDVARLESPNEQEGRFSVKVYPKGKSRSDEHVAVEGWFRLSPDLGRQDLHLRLRPRTPSRGPSSRADDAL